MSDTTPVADSGQHSEPEEAFRQWWDGTTATMRSATLLARIELVHQAGLAMYERGRADERQRLATVVSAEQFRKLAAWFDEDDEVKMMLFSEDPTLPGTWRERGRELQDGLRRFADLLAGDVAASGEDGAT
jgi:hypothetical protein